MTADMSRLPLPADIDALLAEDPAAALAWRMRHRDALTAAFNEGFVIVGFLPARPGTDPNYLLRRGRDRQD
jgi:predicted GNAT superfamily acetyltransferase